MAYGTNSYKITVEIVIEHEFDPGSRLDPSVNMAYIDSVNYSHGTLPYEVYEALTEHDDTSAKMEEWQTLMDGLKEATGV